MQEAGKMAVRARYDAGRVVKALSSMEHLQDELAHTEAIDGMRAVIGWLRELEWIAKAAER